MAKKEYYLGLDLGTNSVGWAVTDTDYNLLRAKGKDLWGVRLFSEASTAADRRNKRVSRRRLEREKARKAILKDFFADEISRVDPGFFLRLDENFLHLSDRSEENYQKFSLFNDANFTDKDYHEKYKTIFHLRSELLKNTAPHDVRLVFIAIYNMFSHRGHFLNSTLDPTKNDNKIDVAYHELVDSLEMFDIKFPHTIDCNALEEKLSNKNNSRSKICEAVANLLNISKKEKVEYAMIKLICGLKVTLKDLCGADELSSDEEKKSVGFRESSFEEMMEEIRGIIGDEWFELINKLKSIHDIGLLASIMRGHEFLSEARVDIYEQHKKDLRQLKELLKEYNRTGYEKVFRTMEEGSYSAYVGSVNSHGKIERRKAKNRKQEDLYKLIKSVIKDIPADDTNRMDIEKKMEIGCFLEKQLTSTNGVIPNQVHSRELRKILENASKYLSFLNDRDERDLSIKDKIIQLFEFQIPYYVGPLGIEFNGRAGYNCWARHKEPGKIYPWNFEEKIDIATSAEEFIKRMVRKCSYLNDEKTLPKRSLLYEKFMVLNEINAISVDGNRLPTNVKQKLFDELFSNGKKISRKKVKEYLVSINAMDQKSEITGIDISCNQSLTSIGKFHGIFGDDICKDSIKNVIEDIIFWGTIYSGDKKLIKEKIKEKYPSYFDNHQLKRVLGLKFEGWGNLSKEFLELEGVHKETGEINSIIGFLWNYQVTLMELLSSNYTFVEELDKKANKLEKPLSEWKIEDLDDMYLSPAVKRMIWQAMLIVDELQSVIGYSPKRIFVEMTRNYGEKVRTTSRKKNLQELYKAIEKEEPQWRNEFDDKDDSYFKSRKLYLYYLQKGRCMYTNHPIDLSKLMNDNLYDLDHIYPQHYTKDDSIENNLVLVEKQSNASKGDMPITEEIQNTMYEFWRELKEQKFITAEKFSRLTRKNKKFTLDEKVGFINRQIVETGQATKVITQILQNSMGEDCKIVFSKARLISDFRHKFNLPKARSVNDFHHAHDAYLNIVVGNAYFVKFTNNPEMFIKEAEKNPDRDEFKYNFGKFFNNDIKNKNEIAWIGNHKENQHYETITTVKKTMQRFTPLVTYKVEVGHGEYFNETIYSHDKVKKESYLGIKTKDTPLADVEKYGGKTSVSTLGYCLIEYREKNKTIKALEELPIFLGDCRHLTEDSIKDFLKKSFIERGKIEAGESLRICEKFIPKQSFIKRDGYYYYLGGRTGNYNYLYNAVQLKLPLEKIEYIHKIEKANLKNDYAEIDKNKGVIIDIAKNCELYSLLVDKFITSIYKNRVANIGKQLQDKFAVFSKLPIGEQCKVLERIILNISKSQKVDLSLIEEVANAGVCLGSMKINGCSEFKLIHQSVTGLFVIEKDLLKL